MPAKLTETEKKLRGTAQKCRAVKARSLRTVRQEIRGLRRLINDIRYNLNLARVSIQTDGVLIETIALDSNGRVAKTRRLNPCFKVQSDSLKALKSLDRQMQLLCDEEDAAMAEQKVSNTHDEFEL